MASTVRSCDSEAEDTAELTLNEPFTEGRSPLKGLKRRPLGYAAMWLRVFVWAVLVLAPMRGVHAETPAPTVHWGGIAYPDQFNTLRLGGTFNRFTEFDGLGTRYNSTLNESFGLNFATMSWTQHWERFEGWSTNVTMGIGPTGPQPTKFLQNTVVHKTLGYAPVQTGQIRHEVIDSMVDASVTRWFPLFNQRRELYVGGGLSGGTIYQEAFARAGIRRASFDSLIPHWNETPLRVLTDYLRFSAMARYGQLESGALLHTVKPHSYLYQASVSLGPYGASDGPPHWEIEYALTWDSGIFVNDTGESRKEFFNSLALTYGAFRFESWNDNVHHKDKGPTYGATVTLDLFRLFKKSGENKSS